MSILTDFVYEREQIRLRKAVGQSPPWTDDPILNTYRFCNIRRRHDRVSQWLIKNVLLEYLIKEDLQMFLEFSAFCRWVNWPPTIKAIIDDAKLYDLSKKKLDWKSIGNFVDDRA